jgi:hypothetical protein
LKGKIEQLIIESNYLFKFTFQGQFWPLYSLKTGRSGYIHRRRKWTERKGYREIPFPSSTS